MVKIKNNLLQKILLKIYFFFKVGDNGESLALTEYDNDNNVYVRTNLIEDKLDKWW